MNSISTLTLRVLPNRNIQITAFFHTTSSAQSRIKRTHTHKPFYHIKKTAKHPDEPLTYENKSFVEDMIKKSYASNPLDSYVRPEIETSEPGIISGSLLRPELQPWQRGGWDEYSERTKRTGLLARKIGVVPMWFANGKRVAATMLQVEDNHVVKYIPPEEFAETIVGQKRNVPRITGRNKPIHLGCLVVGALSSDPQKFTKDYCGLFTESGVMPKKLLARFPVTPNALIQPGTPLNAAHFEPGQFIDVTARASRRGFQGGMKRHGFSGMPSDERGCTKSHRRIGNTGSGRTKHRVFPGQKMPGHVGGNFVTMPGLQIIRINYSYNVIYVLGQSIPGEQGELVKLFDSIIPSKRSKDKPRYFPTCYPEDVEKELPEEEYANGMFKFNSPTISF